MAPIIVSGRVKAGKITLDDERRFKAAVAHLKDGPVHIRVEPAYDGRSNQQNRFWHGIVIPAFAEHCGYDVAEMKRVLALELLPVTVHKMDGTEVVVPGHTADLNTKEFNELIERAQRLGAEMGIYIPDPNEVAA